MGGSVIFTLPYFLYESSLIEYTGGMKMTLPPMAAVQVDYNVQADDAAVATQVRKTPSWPRSWANFIL
jgi:hypothetical protein